MTNENQIEQWAAEEYREGVSVGAAARQLCRSLGANGEAPTLKEMLEDMLDEANEDSLNYSMAIESIRELISIIEFMQAGDGSLPLGSSAKLGRANALLPENLANLPFTSRPPQWGRSAKDWRFRNGKAVSGTL